MRYCLLKGMRYFYRIIFMFTKTKIFMKRNHIRWMKHVFGLCATVLTVLLSTQCQYAHARIVSTKAGCKTRAIMASSGITNYHDVATANYGNGYQQTDQPTNYRAALRMPSLGAGQVVVINSWAANSGNTCNGAAPQAQPRGRPTSAFVLHANVVCFIHGFNQQFS